MKELLDDLTIISKKLGVYEYRFGVTSEQMFVSNKQIDLSNGNSPIKSTIQEWRTCYEDYISKASQIETVFKSLIPRLSQSENKQIQESNPITQQTFGSRIRLQLANHANNYQSYEASEEDRRNLTEIRLPLLKPREPESKNSITTRIYPLQFGKITKKINDSNIPTYSSVLVELQINTDQYQQNIVRLKNSRYLDDFLSSIVYQGVSYPLINVSYRLVASNDFWDEVTSEIDAFTETNDKPQYFSLSLFTSNLDIDESEYKIVYPKPIRKPFELAWRTKTKLEDNNLVELETPIVELEIPIKIEKFCISECIYWLPEAGHPIDFEWQVDLDSHARFGCLGQRMYPITRSRADKYNQKSPNSRKWYAWDTPEHSLGNIALQNVKASLERLQGVTAWESPPNSRADEEFKWDLFFSVGDKVYPLQIKSSLGKAEEALSQYQQTKLPFIPPIIWVNPSNSEEKARKLVEEIAKRFSNILGISLSDKTSTSILFLQTVQNRRSSV